ncbi:MAG: mechanosensitive ion channel domain-containing protein, partial [Nanoarchaeota archaeon]
GPFLIWCAMFALYFALRSTQLPWEAVRIAGKILLVLGIISVTMVLAHIATALVKLHAEKIETALAVTSLTQNIARIVIFIIGILVILNSLGISITPLLATLGVGGLAVALALQDTLANFFAGFHIIVNRQIKIGDYIKIENGDEGYVADINWRTTKVRLLSNNMVLVPNTKLTQSVITNYYLPDKKIVFTLAFGVHYQSDLEKVEKALEEKQKTS